MNAAPAGPRLRFAPSPTGSLHLGNARTALFNWLVARQGAGSFILRIEDTDVERERAGSEETILDDLRWLGLDWDEGPDIGGAAGPYRQSQRGELYRDAAGRLLESGLAFRCFCDEASLARDREARLAAGAAPHYSGHCARMSAGESTERAERGEAFAVRFAAERAALGEPGVGFVDRLRGAIEFPVAQLGDTVILRSDGRPTYNFAVVVDDAAMGIDLVIRGDDHLSNTPRQVLLYRALGHALPVFVHLPLVRGQDGGRLSKRHGAASVMQYRDAGYPSDGLINYLALLGWAPGGDRTLLGRDELLDAFDLDRVHVSPATFDPAKLEWICSQHVQRAPSEELAGTVHRRLAEAGRLPVGLPAGAEGWLVALAEMLRPYLSHAGEIPDRAAVVFHPGGQPLDEAALQAVQSEGARAVLARLAELADASPPEDLDTWKTLKLRLRADTRAKGKELFAPVRVGVTGTTSGPELDVLVPLVEQGGRWFGERVPRVAGRARRTLEWLSGR